MQVYLVVEPGRGTPELSGPSPDVLDVRRVWAGDPHRRPYGEWADLDLELLDGVPWGVLQVALHRQVYALVRGLAAVAAGDGPAVLVQPGRVRVALDAVIPPVQGLGLVRRARPAALNLARAVADGRWASEAIWVGGGARGTCREIAAELSATRTERAGGALAAVLDARRVPVHPAPAIAVATEDWPAEPDPLCLPGGVRVDPAMRAVTAAALDRGEVPPDPFAGSGFLDWLESPWPPWGPDIGRYWNELWHQRPDVAAAHPHPDGSGAAAFAEWAANSWRFEPRSRLIEPVGRRLRPPWPDHGRERGGVNLIGYVTVDNSLGDVARRFLAALGAAGVEHVALDYHRTGSPAIPDPPELAAGPRYATNLVVLNPDQLGNLANDQPGALAGRRTVGFWHWDIEHVPPHVVDAARHLDEVWVLTEFTRGALAEALPVPVRVVLPAVPQGTPSAATRSELGLPADRFVFLVVLDHLSLTERKNPVGAVRAFRRAFPEPAPGGPVLFVKTTNAGLRPADHARIHAAAAGRDDIVVVDRHLPRGDQLALVGHAGCLVSLHRSEGLGLHLCEAMWAGVPTIATRYSGNLAFQDDTNAVLVDATQIAVGEGGEGFFPAHATWADPDLDQAADAMRRILADASLRARLGAAGRATMEAQPTLADTGGRVAELLGLESGRITRS